MNDSIQPTMTESAMPVSQPLDLMTIMGKLEYFEYRFPHDAVDAAIANPELITPTLLQSIQNVIDNPNHYIENEPGYCAHIYAMYLLAQFRETRAYPLVADFASLPGQLVFDLAGDFPMDALGRILASVCGGDQTLIRNLVENEDVNEYVRSQGVQGLVTLVANGMADRVDVLTYFKTILRSATPGKRSPVYEDVIYESLRLYPDLIIDDIRDAYANDIVPEELIDLEEFEKRYALGPDEAQINLHRYSFYTLIDDTVKELEKRTRIEEDDAEEEWVDEENAATWSPEPPDNRWDEPSEPIRNAAPKVGPNDPCPCASGKKYKKCCGR